MRSPVYPHLSSSMAARRTPRRRRLADTACAIAVGATLLTSACNTSGDEGYEIAFIPGMKGDAFYTSMQCGVEERAAELGARVDFQASDKFDPTAQTPLVEAVAAQQPDALLIAPTDTKALYAPIKQIAESGTKIILVDTTLDDPSMAVSRIASDYEQLGATAAHTLLRLIGGHGQVLMIGVQPGISTLDAGQAGFESVLENDPNIDYLGIQYGQNDQAKVAAIVSATLAVEPDLAGVFTPSGPDQAGVVNALKRAGKIGDVKVVSADAQPPQVEQLENGDVQALVGQKPFEMGVQGIDQAIAALDGKPVAESITTGIYVATPDNIDKPSIRRYLYQDSC